MGCGFRRVLIANRGEIAVRIARAVRAEGAEVVAVYSEADRAALHVRHANVAMPIGAADARHSYLSVDAIIGAAKRARADAIHPGYGFLSERPALARACAEAGIAFVGPPASAMHVMGDKVRARAAMQAAGVPVVPGNESAVDLAAATSLASSLGYPVLLKAAAGGGGKGMRLVNEQADLGAALAAAKSEASRAFGDDTVYLEKALHSPRHIEVQIFAGADGEVVAIGERECSLQRRHQKVIEESPSVAVDAALRQQMQEVACRAARAVDYVGAGTIEFLLAADHQFYFLEMNTRLQVEHAVTEAVFNVDLVRAQLQVAAGQPLPFSPGSLSARGHAIEARLYAEDPDRDFAPSPGTIGRIEWPLGPGIRVDAGVAPGCKVSGYYDPMVAKIIAHGADRAEAIMRLRGALRETWLEGLVTNRSVLLSALTSEAFLRGDYHTGSLQEILAEPAMSPPAEATEAGLMAMAIARFHQDSLHAAQAHAVSRSQPGRPGWQLASWQLRGP